MGNYTIKGLAKAYECNELNENGLVEIWSYWLSCNTCDTQSAESFKRLKKKEQQKMVRLMICQGYHELLHQIILNII